MKILLIASISLVLSWLPTTASALLIQYDIEFNAVLWSPELPDLVEPVEDFDGEAIKKTFEGKAIAYFDGQTIIENDVDAFSLPMSFILDVDGTTLFGNGAIDFFTTDTYITMNFDAGPISVSTNDFIYNQTVRDETDGYLYNELLLPMDMPYISSYRIGSNSIGAGEQSILDNILLDQVLDRTLVTLEQVDIKLSNGREIFSVPEPATIWLVGGGLLVLVGVAKRKVRV